MRDSMNLMNLNHSNGNINTTTDNTTKNGKRQLTVPLCRSNKPFSRSPSPMEMVDEFNRSLGTYAEEIHRTHCENEEMYWKSRTWDSFSKQPEVNQQMRAILVDWLIEVAEEYSISSETLFLSVNYIDRVLEVVPITRATLQLLGVSCMLLACKYEEIHTPVVDDFVYITDSTYKREEILKMELQALSVLKFSLTISTVKNFVQRFLLIAEVTDPRASHLASYLAEMTLPIYSIQQKYRPSLIAAAIACHCKSTLAPGLPIWNAAFEVYTSYSKLELKPCIQDIYQVYETISNAPVGRFTSAREKYKQEKYGAVSTIPLSSAVLAL